MFLSYEDVLARMMWKTRDGKRIVIPKAEAFRKPGFKIKIVSCHQTLQQAASSLLHVEIDDGDTWEWVNLGLASAIMQDIVLKDDLDRYAFIIAGIVDVISVDLDFY